jgi:hypothetical protein
MCTLKIPWQKPTIFQVDFCAVLIELSYERLGIDQFVFPSSTEPQKG